MHVLGLGPFVYETFEVKAHRHLVSQPSHACIHAFVAEQSGFFFLLFTQE